MPLDAGAFTEYREPSQPGDGLGSLRPSPIVLATTGTVGSALRAAREGMGLAIDDIAQATRVRGAHLQALESFDFQSLPARPFVIGYVRAYARALGLETESVVARFRGEAPAVDDRLRAPWNLRDQFHRRRFGWIGVVVLMMITAVVAWNIFRHVSVSPRRVAVSARRPVPLGANAGPTHLGAPLPAPPEAAAPPTYETPGLAADAAPAPAEPTGAPFVAAGQIYGAPPGGGVLLQAKKPTSLVVRGPGGVVYFARQLATGEAWRSPAMPGLEVDVGNPASMEVYFQSVSRGELTAAKTPVSSLTDALPAK